MSVMNERRENGITAGIQYSIQKAGGPRAFPDDEKDACVNHFVIWMESC